MYQPGNPPQLPQDEDDKEQGKVYRRTLSRWAWDFSRWVYALTFGPTAASFVTVNTESALQGARKLTAGSNITLTDGGAGSTLTIASTGGSSPLTTKGDLYGHSTVDARVPVGADGALLTADSTQALGVGWKAPSTIGNKHQAQLMAWCAYRQYRSAQAINASEWNVTGALSGAVTAPGGSPQSVLYDQYRKARVTSATTLNAAASYKVSTVQPYVFFGTAAGCGGFYLRARFGLTQVASTHRLWFGVSAGNLAMTGDLAANAVTDAVGVECDAGDANLQFYTAKSGAIGTRVDLGASFAKTTANQMYELIMQVDPNSNVVNYSVTNLTAGVTVTGSTSSTVPNGTVTMFYNWTGIVNPAGTAVIIDDGGYYLDAPPY